MGGSGTQGRDHFGQREGPFHSHQWSRGRERSGRDGVRGHSKRRSSVVTGEKSTIVPGEGYGLNLAMAQITSRKGMTAPTVVFPRHETLIQVEGLG